MGRISSMFDGITRSLSIKGTKAIENEKIPSNCVGKEAAESMAKDAKRNEMILKRPGIVNGQGSKKNLASVSSRKGGKGVNQDCCVVWEDFGCQADMTFCGIFDGHGPWGHFVAKYVAKSMPKSLLYHWQQALVEGPDFDMGAEEKLHISNLWKNSFTKTCAAVDLELLQNRRIDSFYSGTTALSVVKQGDAIFLANVGDSRAVVATVSDDGNLVAVQLTVDFKPNLPHEAERISECKGRVLCTEDEPGVHRVWAPHKETPGLAISRAFGDYCLKDFGLISLPEVTQMHVTDRDQFIILATDGVWDVVSNQEAVGIVSMVAERAKSAKLLVESAVKAWKRKKKGFAVDDISAIVLFFPVVFFLWRQASNQ